MQSSLSKHEWDWSTNKNGSMIGVSFYDSGRINFLSNVKVHNCSQGNHSNEGHVLGSSTNTVRAEEDKEAAGRGCHEC